MLTIVVPEMNLQRTYRRVYYNPGSEVGSRAFPHLPFPLGVKWHKPFLTKDERTEAETLDYIRCMTITKNVDPRVYFAITPENISEIKKYIDDPMTATTFKNYGKPDASKDIVTSEVIYYQMVALQIPFECEKWHLNRL